MDARLFTVAVDVREEQELDLTQLLKANDHWFVHDPPGNDHARWLGHATRVAKKERIYHELFRVRVESCACNLVTDG